MSVTLPALHEELLGFVATMPEDGYRYEIADGELIVTPPSSGQHQDLAAATIDLIDHAVPERWAVRYTFGVEVAGRYLVPDLVVFDARPPDLSELFTSLRPRLVVEIESPSTRRRDRISKPAWYAEGGCDAFWRIEADQTIHVHTLPTPDGLWNEVRTVRPGERLELTDPFPITLRSPFG